MRERESDDRFKKMRVPVAVTSQILVIDRSLLRMGGCGGWPSVGVVGQSLGKHFMSFANTVDLHHLVKRMLWHPPTVFLREHV